MQEKNLFLNQITYRQRKDYLLKSFNIESLIETLKLIRAKRDRLRSRAVINNPSMDVSAGRKIPSIFKIAVLSLKI